MQGHEIRIEPLVRAQLLRLPEYAPDPLLWARIELAHAQRKRVSRQRRLSVIAGALAASCAIFFIVPNSRDMPISGLFASQQESQALEHSWLSAPRDAVDPTASAQLRLIDHDLQAAYDRGADESELIPLWNLRSAALRDLIDNAGQASRLVTRI